jgi:BirA family biotin operon repressor/biotin-[acetyl-CoA-carboxylase] ligase
VIAGIGINVNHTAFPQELTNTATSLRIATGREHSREELLLNLVDCIDVHCDILAKKGREAILMLFSEHSSFVRGRRVVVDQGGASIEGTTEGLDESGFLIVRKPDGRRSLILAGGVRPAP